LWKQLSDAFGLVSTLGRACGRPACAAIETGPTRDETLPTPVVSLSPERLFAARDPRHAQPDATEFGVLHGLLDSASLGSGQAA